ncbi:MAG: hypothetical protein WC326_12290 [Candidatus Delongbacteria bacterium]
MRGTHASETRRVEEIRLALLSAQPERAAELLTSLLRDSGPLLLPQARRLAETLGALRDAWPDSLEQGGQAQALWLLAQGPLLNPRLLQ